MAEQYGLTDVSELPVNVYVPTETFRVKWRKDKAAMKDKGYWAHKACRERKVLNVENLSNLKEVAGTKFIFSCLPLKIRRGTGSPVRAVAIYTD